jgi:hypothetical protein
VGFDDLNIYGWELTRGDGEVFIVSREFLTYDLRFNFVSLLEFIVRAMVRGDYG